MNPLCVLMFMRTTDFCFAGQISSLSLFLEASIRAKFSFVHASTSTGRIILDAESLVNFWRIENGQNKEMKNREQEEKNG